MTSFRKIALVTVLSLASIGTVYGQTNPTAPQYRDVLKQCGADWKASEARRNVAKGEGAAKWQEFRAKCVLDKGWKKGTRSANSNA
jgi:hypothetical protein